VKKLFGLFSILLFIIAVAPASAAVFTCAGVDDTIPLQAAINANDEVFVAGACQAGNLTTPAPRYIHGDGVTSSITFLTGYTGYLLDGGTHRLVLRDLALYGQSAVPDFRYQVTAVSTRSAVRVDGQQRNLIGAVYAEGFDNYCFRVEQVSAFSFAPRTRLVNLSATRCLEAYSLASEFTRHSGLVATQVSIGLAIRAGNVVGADCQMVDNRINLYVAGVNVGVSNDGHGSVAGCEFAHAITPASQYDVPGYSVYIEGVSQGFAISGSQIHAGNIYLKDSTGVVISGGEIQVGWILLGGGVCNLITGNHIFSNPGAGLTNNVVHNYVASDATVITRNITPTGWFPNSVGSTMWCPP
jgi:hypothetical protein